MKQIQKLDYPKSSISLGFLVSDSKDQTWINLNDIVKKLTKTVK